MRLLPRVCAIVTLAMLPFANVHGAQTDKTLKSLRALLDRGTLAHKQIRLETMPVPANLAVEAEKARTHSLKWISVTESFLESYRKHGSLANEYSLVTSIRETELAIEGLGDLLGRVHTHEALYDEARPLILAERASGWVDAIRAIGGSLHELHMAADSAFYARLLALEE